MSDPGPEVPQQRPVPLLLAAGLVAVQGCGLIVLGGWEGIDAVGDRGGVGVSTAVFLTAYGVGLVACAWALTRRGAWARGPVLLTQLIQLGVAWNQRDEAAVAVALALVAAATLALMLQPASIAALSGAAEDTTP